jgi:hypothetical protein
MKKMFSLLVITSAAVLCPLLAYGYSVSCGGTTYTGAHVKTSNTPTTSTSTTFVSLAGATYTVSVPANSTRAIIVTFSAETRLTNNNGTSPANNWIELRVRDNGVALQPADDTSPLAFASADLFEGHSITFCKTVTNTTGSAQNHNITVVYKVTDNDGLGNLQAWLDDWTLRVDVAK